MADRVDTEYSTGARMLMTTVARPLVLSRMPYHESALEPFISARTIAYHYGRHHAGYVRALNELVTGTSFVGRTLEEIVLQTARDSEEEDIFRNAAQVWNHDFYWLSMGAKGGDEPTGRLKRAIESEFGSFTEFRKVFTKAALGEFGSGWVWLVVNQKGNLEIVVTSDADTPLIDGKRPLITLDLWEHAYYLDFQNRRADYVAAWFSELVDWRFAERNFG
jgi:Fe-Mn family superoxide dismutase